MDDRDSSSRSPNLDSSLISSILSHRKSQPFDLVRRIGTGVLAAVYVFIVLVILLVAAAILAVWLLRYLVEEPVQFRQPLQFDYSNTHPSAVAPVFGGVPVGQSIHASLVLLMPESDYNIDLGMFQVTGEILSGTGEKVAKSSQPCILRFTSWPIRMIRTFFMGIPLLLELTSETQIMSVSILKHKEVAHLRTESIQVTLLPRSGTCFLPQLYKAHLVVESRLPWTKHLIYMWKWTIYVWITFYTFFIMALLFFKPLISSHHPTPLPIRSN